MDTKPWWQSRAVWGGVVCILAPLLHVTVEDSSQIADLCTAAAGVIGGAVAVYGRVRATKVVTS